MIRVLFRGQTVAKIPASELIHSYFTKNPVFHKFGCFIEIKSSSPDPVGAGLLRQSDLHIHLHCLESL